jgi:uncharacterized protein (TIGR03000 family)
MFGKTFSCGGVLLLAGTVVFVTPGLGHAQHGGGGHGGGHGGGGHFGGGHFGGAHFGGAGSHFGGANHFGGGFRGGIHNGGMHYGGSRFGYDWNRYYQGGYHPYYGRYRHFYGGYGYYPYYGLYGSYPYSSYDYGVYPYLGSDAYDSGYTGAYGATTSSFDYGNTPINPPVVSPVMASAQPDPIAYVTVRVPGDAKLWFDDTLTTSTGSTRQFDTPPLTPGTPYSYEVRATWNDKGHEVTQTQHVEVTAGARIDIGFPIPPKTAADVPAVKKG